jgi:predicted hydrocarbon binding protein
MDEFFEFAENLALLNDLSENELLNEENLEALVEILHGVDYFPSSTELIEAFSGLNLEEMDSWNAMDSNFFESLSVAEESQFLAGLDADPLEVTASFNLEQLDPVEMANFDFAATYTEAEAVTGRLSEALSSIPEPFQKDLGSIDWKPILHTENGMSYSGLWSQNSGNGLSGIKLFNAAEEAECILYHEIGHHIAHLDSGFLKEFTETSLTEPDLWNFEREHLSNYSDIKVWDDELFAQSIRRYLTQREILQDLAPRTFEVIDRRWKDALAAQMV